MINELVIISGKGGTGKTGIAASFAEMSHNAVIADCDVDAADLHLMLSPSEKSAGDFDSGKKAFVNSEQCTECGKCIELCRFDAISSSYIVDDISCEGCGVCARFCPAGAIEMRNHISGRWYISDTSRGSMVHAKLGIAEGNSGKLVSEIKKKARDIADEEERDLIIVDGSPGIGCPVIATLSGATFALIVTEPSVSGLHDLKRIYELTKRFQIKTAVCVNKADIHPEVSGRIKDFCEQNGSALFMKIPFDTDVSRAVVAGSPVVKISDGPASKAIRSMWEKIKAALS